MSSQPPDGMSVQPSEWLFWAIASIRVHGTLLARAGVLLPLQDLPLTAGGLISPALKSGITAGLRRSVPDRFRLAQGALLGQVHSRIQLLAKIKDAGRRLSHVQQRGWVRDHLVEDGDVVRPQSLHVQVLHVKRAEILGDGFSLRGVGSGKRAVRVLGKEVLKPL